MNQQPFFSLDTPDTFTDAEIAEFEARMNAPEPANRLAECEDMFDVVVRIYELTPESEKQNLHPFFKMFHDMANGLNTVSIDSEELDQSPDAQKPQHLNDEAFGITGKINPIDSPASGSIVNQ
jgi:hypothetical protein